ncbi:MAG: flagellin [Tepidanaerobacteraceae bacterium]
MRINNNIMALNTHRQLSINNTNTSKSLEKLSSGYRINRAGDDAAGLAISEKMRAQIRGLNMASKNAQDGISLIQTAEGALTEVHAILQRMRELAVQSANDTNIDVDRSEIQKEIDQLTAEITRIAETTEFNTKNLLGGEFKGIFHIGANEGQNIELSINDMSAAALGVEGNMGLVKKGVEGEVAINDIEDTHLADAETGGVYSVQKLSKSITLGTTDIQYVLRDIDDNIVGVSVDGQDWKLVKNNQVLTNDINKVDLEETVGWSVKETHNKIISGTIVVTGKEDRDSETYLTFKADATLADKPGLTAGEYTMTKSHALFSGKNVLLDAKGNVVAYYEAEADNDHTWKTLDGQELFKLDPSKIENGDKVIVGGGGGIDVSSQVAADKAITVINNAIEKVSTERSKLGAYQNRLEHTIRNLDTSAENLQAAESRIRDVDMAKEMMEFTKQNILMQAATAMLAQANMAPQTVLQLLG